MATDVNRASRKRKSTSDLIFEVDETDCSPPNTPEPIPESASCAVSVIEAVSHTSADTVETVVTLDNTNVAPKPDVDLRCMDMDVESSSPMAPDLDKPFVTLIFRDKAIASRHRLQIVNYIKTLVNFSLNEEAESDLKINLWENSGYESPCHSTCVEVNHVDLFVVDTTPSKSREVRPRYLSTSGIDELDPDKPNDAARPNHRPVTVCFNCDGNHPIRECTETKDHRRIMAARNKYMSNAQAKNTRYHKDEEQKYKHLVPGKISDKLRRALDLRRQEIPPYVYRMRTLGYPPGWLQEALVTSTRLELFDFQGCIVEDGKPENSIIDPSKVIEYPGFNVPVEEGFKDEYKYYKCPPFDENHSKKTMLEYIKNMAVLNGASQQKEPTVEDKPVPEELVPPGCTESDSTSQDSEAKETKTKRSESPTLTDLELRKKQLLAELEDGSLNSPQTIASENGDKSTSELTSPCVVSSAFGTPILKSASPYAQLPDRDKFSKDISQVINFENLPNSTGKYEQMSRVISKVRETVKSTGAAENDKS